MKNTIKMLVFDVGNTLIETRKGDFISSQVKSDLNVLREKGYILGISTLRTEKMLAPVLKQFEFDFMVLMNGGLVKLYDETIYSCPIDDGVKRQIIAQAEQKHIEIKRYDDSSLTYALELKAAKDSFVVGTGYQYYIWEQSGNIDITSLGVTKLSGLRNVCEKLEISPEEVMAFGDGYNDIELLSSAGYGVAMGGAPSELCDVSDMITSSVSDDGISVALRRLEIL